MPSKTIRWNDWSKGHWGDMGRRVAGRQPGFFEGSNVKVYSDGNIGPRPGLKKVANDNWSTNGVVRGLFFTANVGNELVVCGEWGTTIYDVAVTTTTETQDTFTWNSLTGTLGATPSDWCTFDRYDPNTIYMLNPDDAPYELDLAGDAVTAITMPATSGQGWAIRLWRDRLYIASHDNDTVTQRIWYSDAGDFTTVDAAGYFDISYHWPIWSMDKIRNGLLIGTQGDGWWLLTGPPDTGTLRQLFTRGEPDRPPTVVVDDEETLWYLPQNNRPLARTNGATWDFDTYEHLFLSGNEHHGDWSYGNRDIMFTTTDGSDDILAMHNDVWVHYDSGVPIDGPITRFSADYFLLASDGTASTDADFYWYDNSLERPGFTSDSHAACGDGSDTPLTATLNSPEFVAKDGNNIRVKNVIVDFIKYDTGSATDNEISLVVRSTAGYQQAGDIDSTAAQWTEATGSATTAGTSERFQVGFSAGTIWSGGFQLRFTALKGVLIKDVTIVVDEEPHRGGATQATAIT